jgi:3D (Asp-Asp-Asp) domain-containing protein
MHVPGYGWGEVKDTGMAIKGDRIDVFFESNKEAIKWGKKYLKVAIILPDKYKTER